MPPPEDGGRPRVVVAPDKFKGTLTAPEAAEALAAGVRRHWPGARISTVPLADGGEGTVDAAVAAGAQLRRTPVRGALGSRVRARWALRTAEDGSTTAVVESAEAAGLDQVRPSPATARAAHSYGCGQLIRAALDAGASDVVVALGGSAMTDGGSGALRALGLEVLDDGGAPVPLGGAGLLRAARLNTSGLDPRLRSVRLRLAVDVRNPLYGSAGAAHVFAGQKGADAGARAELDAALRRWAALLAGTPGTRPFRVPGAGAAGGFPSGFLALTPAVLEGGFELVAALVGLEERLRGADLLLVGEGSLDEQSLQGKAPLAAAALAAARGIPVVAVAGRLSLSARQLREAGVGAAASLVDVAPSEDAARARASHYAGPAVAAALRQLDRAPSRGGGDAPVRTHDDMTGSIRHCG
ncbi:glycerate kinase [Kocuria sp. CNJ-770]|uniref:Glycerate kinase n=1 Tax=Kocuria oceani TaxID=988827 RepID=A0ABV9TDJ6_9MICC|nr:MULTISPECIES: glycerate kinase [Kocuria]OLT09707.1 glycerate kinase [Kocuria sp. CNJ-770]